MIKYYGREQDISRPPKTYDSSQLLKHFANEFIGCVATGMWTAQKGFILQKDSHIRKEITCKTNKSIKRIQDKLLRDKVIISSLINPEYYQLKEDIRVSSPSSAACLICGNDRNGNGWETETSQTLPNSQ